MSNFPIFLSEVDVFQYHAFHFSLPAEDIGRDDILIHVEYEISENNIVFYHAWAQYQNSYFRAHLISSSILLTGNGPDVISKIVFALNSSPDFYEQLYSFIGHFGNPIKEI